MSSFQSATPSLPQSPTAAGRPFTTGVLLALVAILPGLIFFLGASSLATGTVIAATAIIAADFAGMLGTTPSGKTAVAGILAALAVGIGIHLYVGMALNGQGDAGRAGLSFAVFIVMTTAAWVLAAHIPMISERAIDRIMFGLLGLFVFAAILGVAGLQPPSPRGILAKSVFPFSEPSHYAFSAAPLLIFSCLRLTFFLRSLIIVVFLCIAYALQSLSLVVVVALAAVVTLPVGWFILAITIAASLITLLDVEYFTDRLDFSAHSTNVSSLIYIQGIELAENSIARTFGWGIGFQQLGVGEIHSLTANAIAAILREDSNIYDGGFTSAKLISEFGLFAVAGILAYLVMAMAIVLKIRRTPASTPLPAADIFFAAAVLGFLIELFIRGAGYFTGTSMLTLASIFYYMRKGGISDLR